MKRLNKNTLRVIQKSLLLNKLWEKDKKIFKQKNISKMQALIIRHTEEVWKCQEYNWIHLWFNQECVKIKFKIKNHKVLIQNKKKVPNVKEYYLQKDKSLKLALKDICKKNL